MIGTKLPVPGPFHSQPPSIGASVFSSERISHNVAMRLKDYESKFDGDLGECWSEYVDSCLQIAKDYNLCMEQKLQYLHNMLSKHTLGFIWMSSIRTLPHSDKPLQR